MSRATKIVSINVSPEKVMEYISNIRNHPAFIPPLKAVENISGDPTKPGTVWDWTFVMAGIEFKGKSETVEYQPAKVFKYKTTGGISSTFTYSVEAEGSATRLTMDVEYEVPASLLGKANQAAVEKVNGDSAQAAEENIKTILEG
jgi:carbon monoxide dehydrogenase subunit G